MQIYRSYIAQGQYDIVQDEIKDDAQTALQAVKLLATYKSKPDMKDMVLMTIKEWLADSSTANNPVLQTVAGIIYLELGELEEAARVVHAGTTLEMVSLQVQIYLRMSRVEVAQKSLALMSRMEDDATLTQLTGAWVNMALGGEKVQEAFYTFQVCFCFFIFIFFLRSLILLFIYTFQELADKYNETPLLLNGMAACKMLLGQFEDAEKYLLKALAANSTDVQTLQNLVVCSQVIIFFLFTFFLNCLQQFYARANIAEVLGVLAGPVLT